MRRKPYLISNNFLPSRSRLRLAKGADASLNVALQDLMIRVSKAYFVVLQDEENLTYNEANKRTNAEELNQVKQNIKWG